MSDHLGHLVASCASSIHVLRMLKGTADVLHGAAPGYLRDYCKETHSSASGLLLRSTDKCDLLFRRMKTRFGDRAFSAADPRCWNKLPAALRAANSIDSFKTGLKTYLFSKAYSAVS